jgi:hypothetical protein
MFAQSFVFTKLFSQRSNFFSAGIGRQGANRLSVGTIQRVKRRQGAGAKKPQKVSITARLRTASFASHPAAHEESNELAHGRVRVLVAADWSGISDSCPKPRLAN